MNFPADNCFIPKWPIVRQAGRVGIFDAMDRPWKFLGGFDRRQVGITTCNCSNKRCRRNRVCMSCEEFTVHGRKAPVFIGQCQLCGFIYWGVPQ
jgi:hypothetical protein